MRLQFNRMQRVAVFALVVAIFLGIETHLALAEKTACGMFSTSFQETAKRYFYLGEQRFNEGSYEQAIALYDCTIRFQPRNGQAYYHRGVSYWYLDDYERSIQDFSTAMTLSLPEPELPYYMRGFTYLQLGETTRAIQDLTQAIRINASYAIAYTARGRAYERDGHDTAALQDYTSAIEYAEGEALVNAYVFRGDLYRRMRIFEPALADLNAAVELNPDDPISFVYRGQIYRCMNQYPQAVEDFTKAIELDPDYAYAYYLRGIALSQNCQCESAPSDFESALSDFETAIAHGLTIREAYYSKGFMQFQLERYQDAIESFNAAIAVDSAYDDAFTMRGNAFTRLHRFGEALSDFETAIAINPGNPEPYRGLGAMYESLGSYSASLWYYKKYLGLAGSSAASDTTGIVLTLKYRLLVGANGFTDQLKPSRW